MRTQLSLMSNARAIWVSVLMLTHKDGHLSVLYSHLSVRLIWLRWLTQKCKGNRKICRFQSCWHNYRYQYDSASMLQMWSRVDFKRTRKCSFHSNTDEVNSLRWGYWCLIDFSTSAVPLAWLSVHKQFEGISEVHRHWGMLDSSLYNCISGPSVTCRNKNESEMRWECNPNEIILILVWKWLWFI